MISLFGAQGYFSAIGLDTLSEQILRGVTAPIAVDRVLVQVAPGVELETGHDGIGDSRWRPITGE
jgi:hypothetical protein